MKYKYRRRTGSKWVTLKPVKNKTLKDYKNIDNYLKSIYRNNKEYFDKNMDVLGDSRKKRDIFVDQVKKIMRHTYVDERTGETKNYNVRQAIDIFQRSERITTKEERMGEIFLERLKKDKQGYHDFRKAIGYTRKIHSSYFIEESSKGDYNYLRYRDPDTGKDIVIEEVVSPKSGLVKGVKVYEDYDEFRYQYVKKWKNTDKDLEREYELLKGLRKSQGKEV